MLLVWQTIGTIVLTTEWQFTELSAGSLYRITHAVSGNSSGTLRAVIGQEVESVVFDRRLIGYKPGVLEGQFFIKPAEVESRRLAVQRLDVLSPVWTIKIEELIDMAVTFPLPISDIDGLQQALDVKLDDTDLVNIQGQIDEKADASEVETALSGKAPTIHGHVTDDITGLTQLIEFLQPRSNIITSPDIPIDPFPGLIWHEINANNLVESWVFLNRWLSVTKYSISLPSPTNGIGATASYVIPVDFRYDYFFADVMLHCDYNVTSTLNSSNNWEMILTVQSTGNVILNSEAILEDNISKIFEINDLYSFSAGERLQLLFQKNGTAPNIRMGVHFTYHLVRK